ncbi:MAG TPA: glycosyltransferase family 87 protein [Ktedonobacterales bacterium]|jgi:hypothetical protein
MWRRYSLVAGWVVVVAGWLGVAAVLLLKVPLTGSDFSVYLAAAQALRFDAHANIYSEPTIVAAVSAHGGCTVWGLPYLYQPLLALLLEPLAAMPCADAWYVWQALNLVLWAACAFALARRASRVSPWLALFVAALALSFLPLIQGLAIGEIHVIILSICLAGAALERHDRPYLAGVLLGVGAVIKYFPALLILYYLLRGRWRVAVGATTAVGVLLLAEWLIVGPRTLLMSVTGIHYAATVESQGGVSGSLALAALAGLGFIAGVLWAGRARGGDEWTGAAWAIATILVISPLVQWSYLTWLLPALTVCLSAMLDARHPVTARQRWGTVGLLVVAFGLMLVRMLLVRAPNPAPAIALTSTLGAFVVWGLCGAYYLRSAGAKLRVVGAPLRRPAAGAREPAPAPLRP